MIQNTMSGMFALALSAIDAVADIIVAKTGSASEASAQQQAEQTRREAEREAHRRAMEEYDRQKAVIEAANRSAYESSRSLEQTTSTILRVAAIVGGVTLGIAGIVILSQSRT